MLSDGLAYVIKITGKEVLYSTIDHAPHELGDFRIVRTEKARPRSKTAVRRDQIQLLSERRESRLQSLEEAPARGEASQTRDEQT